MCECVCAFDIASLKLVICETVKAMQTPMDHEPDRPVVCEATTKAHTAEWYSSMSYYDIPRLQLT